MAKIIEQITETSWSITEEIGPTTTTYMVYDEDPNIDKYAHEFSRLSEKDMDSIKESLGVRNGSQGDKGGLQYTYDGGASFPSAGGFAYQYSDDYYSIIISPTDNDGNSLANYFNSILGSVSAKVYITSNTNDIATVDVWNIDAINTYQNDGSSREDVTYISLVGSLIGNSTNFTIGDSYSINIVFGGLDGRGGASGSSGTSGTSGSSGSSGSNGITGGHVLTKPISGRQYSVRIMGVSSFTYASMTPNTVILSPFIPANTLTISSLKINVPNATVGASARILVYSNLNGSPSSKLLESSTFDCSSSGDKTFTTTYTFTAGTTYWLGVHTNISLSLIIIEPGNAIPISSNSFYGAYYTTNTSATFLSAPATLTTSTATLAQGYPPSIILTAA
jgi:hypothetical protein